MTNLNRMLPLTMLATGLIVTLVAASAQAATPAYGPIPFSSFDLDGNGWVSQEEFNTVHSQRMAERAARGMPAPRMAQAPGFSAFDADGDGRVTEAEFNAGRQARMQGPMGMGRGMGMAPGLMLGAGMGAGMGRNAPRFEEFDLNHNGVIDEQEFIEARGQRISERARQGYPMRGLANMMEFPDVDANADGGVTPEEFQAGQMRHRMRSMP